MLYIVNFKTFTYHFHEQIFKKVWTSEYDYFSVSALLIDCKCVMLLYFVVRVIPVKSGHGHFGQNQNKKIISRLKIVYINNILFIYTIFRTFLSSENEFDRNDHDRI